MRLVAILCACVVVGVGLTLLPSVRTLTSAIFSSLGGTEDMPAFLALMVQFWPVVIAIGIFVGAVFIIRSRRI